MRIAVVSDIHANRAAWEAVENHLKQRTPIKRILPCDKVVSLGDLIGYGPDNLFCAGLALRNEFDYWLPGNHEESWLVLRDCLVDPEIRYDAHHNLPEIFCRLAKLENASEQLAEVRSIYQELSSRLSERLDQRYSLKTRPEAIAALLRFEMEEDPDGMRETFAWLVRKAAAVSEHKVIDNGIEIRFSHAFDSQQEYIYPWYGAYLQGKKTHVYWDMVRPILESYRAYPGPLCLVFGHSHVPLYCPIDTPEQLDDLDMSMMQYGRPQRLGRWLTLINPGSLGFPSDTDERAAFAIIDTESRAPDAEPQNVTYYRLDYQRSKTSQRIGGADEFDRLQQEFSTAAARGTSGFPFDRLNDMLGKRKHKNGGL